MTREASFFWRGGGGLLHHEIGAGDRQDQSPHHGLQTP